MVAKKNVLNDLTGQDIHNWSVLRRDTLSPNVTRWICRCRCGTECSVRAQSLARNASKNCRRCGYRKNKNKLTSKFWWQILGGARIRELEFDISKEYVWSLFEKQGRQCALTGLPIKIADTIAEHCHGHTTASLDRIDSTKGYVVGNVQWVHKTLNKMKMSLPESEFVEMCRLVTNKHKVLAA